MPVMANTNDGLVTWYIIALPEYHFNVKDYLSIYR